MNSRTSALHSLLKTPLNQLWDGHMSTVVVTIQIRAGSIGNAANIYTIKYYVIIKIKNCHSLKKRKPT